MIEMLSSVVNSLTYRVLSHLFFTYLWHFLAIYTYFCDKKLWNLSTFLMKYDSIMTGTFCIHFWSTFWKKLTVYAVFGSQISKNVYILGFFGMLLYCFVVRLFYVLFRIIYHMFCSFCSSKIMCFHVFRKTIIIMISPSGTASYMTEWWSFAQVCENVI